MMRAGWSQTAALLLLQCGRHSAANDVNTKPKDVKYRQLMSPGTNI